jgi:hypothetical protein
MDTVGEFVRAAWCRRFLFTGTLISPGFPPGDRRREVANIISDGTGNRHKDSGRAYLPGFF